MAATIIDNGGAGYSEAGSGWATAGSANYCYGGTYRLHVNSAGAEKAQWAFSGLTAGSPYGLALTWPNSASVATNTPWKIYDSDGTTVLASGTLNQLTNVPADFANSSWSWKKLTHVVPTGTSLTLEINDNANNYILADAAWLLLGSPFPSTVIVGVNNPGFSSVGSWSTTPSGWVGDYWYIASGSGSNSVKFQTAGLGAGLQYGVYLTWVASGNRATNTPWTIYDSDGTTSLATGTINQQSAPSGVTDNGLNWTFLANATPTGTSLTVKLTDNANGFVIAEAARVAPTSAPLTLSITDTQATQVSLGLTAAIDGTAAFSYQLQRAPDSSGAPGAWANQGAAQGTLTWTNTGLTQGTTYWFRVVNTDANSKITWSNQLSVVPNPAPTGNVEWVMNGSTAIASAVFSGSVANLYDGDFTTSFVGSDATNGYAGIDLGSGIALAPTYVYFSPNLTGIANNDYIQYARSLAVEYADSTAGPWTNTATTPAYNPFRYVMNRFALSPGVSKRCWRLKNPATSFTLSELRWEGAYTYGVTWKPARPVISPAAGKFVTGTSITITSATTNATIYYTTDGTTPTSGSTLYTGAISLPVVAAGAKLTIKAIAYFATATNTTSDVTTGVFGPLEFVPDSGNNPYSTGNVPEDWYDSNGYLLEAHGGDMLFDPATYKYYWYGCQSAWGDLPTGVFIYSSTDLYNWTFETVVVPYTGAGANANFQTRPHALYNQNPSDPTRKYILWVHNGDNNGSMLVYKAALAKGPFTFIGVDTTATGDAYLFDDANGTRYLVSNVNNATKRVWVLDPATDYSSMTGAFTEIDTVNNREAAVLCQIGGYYYLIDTLNFDYNADGNTAGQLNGIGYKAATTLAGLDSNTDWSHTPYAVTINAVTKATQPAAIFKPHNKNGFIFIQDRWAPGEGSFPLSGDLIDLHHARAALWPMPASAFSAGTLSMATPAHWDLSSLSDATPQYTISGPASGAVNATSGVFTLALASGTFNGANTISFSFPANMHMAIVSNPGGSASIVGSSAVVTPANGATGFTFTFAPTVTGAKTTTPTNAQGWADPAAFVYTVNAASSASSSQPPIFGDFSALDAAAVTPSDSTDLTNTAYQLWIGVSGDVALITAGGDLVTFKAAPVGILHVRVKRVKATGTTATSILALT